MWFDEFSSDAEYYAATSKSKTIDLTNAERKDIDPVIALRQAIDVMNGKTYKEVENDNKSE